MNNKKSKAQFFRDNGEVFDKEKESYQTWYKKCGFKYFPDKRELHNALRACPCDELHFSLIGRSLAFCLLLDRSNVEIGK